MASPSSSPSSRRAGGTSSLLLLLLFSLFVSTTAQPQPLASSQSKALHRVTILLGTPSALSSLATATDPCALPPTPSLAIVCAGGQVTSLSVLGDRAPALPPTFSADALFTTLTGLPSLSRLSLVGLGVRGTLPGAKLLRLQSLQELNLSSNYFHGAVPEQVARMYSLQSLVLADNNFTGEIPRSLSSLRQLQFLDFSRNSLQGRIPSSIFALPALRHINLSNNRLSGELPVTTACAATLELVDVSANLLVGPRPACMRSSSSARTVLDAGNCFADAKLQRPSTHCDPPALALAAMLPPPQGGGGKHGGVGMVLGIVGGALLVAAVVMVVVRKHHPEMAAMTPKSPLVTLGKKAEGGKPLPKVAQRITTAADKRHASQAARVNTLEVPAYRAYTMEELQELTKNFASSNLIKNSPLAQHYNGQLPDGTRVLVRCLRLKPKYSPQSLSQYMETISKFRHRHLASIIGHCIVDDQENATFAGSVYLISECITNGSLRSHITEWRKREMLKWPQRVSVVIGIARGIQFLHNVTAPDIVQNDLSIEKILLDMTLTSKISDFSLPLISTSKNGKVSWESPFAVDEENIAGSAPAAEQRDTDDIYQFGLILLEVITGKSTESQRELDSLKAQLSEALTEDPDTLKDIVDPTIRGTFAVDSLSKVTEIALNCTDGEESNRPSVDDVLWNLQYSMQVQDGWASSESLSLSFRS